MCRRRSGERGGRRMRGIRGMREEGGNEEREEGEAARRVEKV